MDATEKQRNEDIAADVFERVQFLLLDVATKLADAHSPWDGGDIDGEMVFFGGNAFVAEAIRSAVK